MSDTGLKNFLVQAMCDSENQPHQWMDAPDRVEAQLGLADTPRLTRLEVMLSEGWIIMLDEDQKEWTAQDPKDDAVHGFFPSLRALLDEVGP